MSFLRSLSIGAKASAVSLSLLFSGVAWAGPDLTVEMHGRSEHVGGQTYFPAAPVQFDFRVMNIGDATAPGAIIARKGYTIDVVLSQDNAVRPGLARYRTSFTDDVLLLGGHFRDTRDLAPGADQAWIGPERLLGSPPRPYTYLSFPLPTGLSPGTYFLCVHVDPENRVAENNERNNATCMAINIRSYVFPKARKLP